MNAVQAYSAIGLVMLPVLCAGCRGAAGAADAAISESRFCAHRQVEYIVGNLPVVISVPHGGRLAPSTIPDRTRGTLQTDVNTDLLAREIAQAFYRRTGKRPHTIICHVRRVKVDCNRTLEEGALDDPGARRVWESFHGFIETALDLVLETDGEALYIDLHGHSHPEALLELGYLVSNRLLQGSDDALLARAPRSSIGGLVDRHGVPFLELLRGESSFGALMQRRGFASVPSPAHPHADAGKYFGGGYNTRRYCVRDDGRVSGFQVECPRKGMRDTEANRMACAEAFADAVLEFLGMHTPLTW